MSEPQFDVVVAGAGTAGIPCAVEAAQGGATVLLVEKDERIGGTLHATGGHLSAAGTRRQAERGIADDTDRHFKDVQRISRGSARQDLVRLAVELAPGTVDWLDDHGFAFAAETPRLVHGHEAYDVPRTYYGTEAGLSILGVLLPLLEKQVTAGRVTVWTRTPVAALLTQAGRVAGITVRTGSGEMPVRAGAVVLTTGGFAANAELFAELEQVPLVSAAHPTSTGDGLLLARSIGAAVTGRGKFLPTFGGLPHPSEPGRTYWPDRPLLIAAERPPWEIYVDKHGRRFVAEDEPSIDAKERALAAIDDMTFWTVFDDAARRNSAPMVAGWTPDDMKAKAGIRPGVHGAATLAELAGRAGISPQGLVSTVARYNDAVARGHDGEHGRRYLPAALSVPPFYALENHGISLVSFAGLDVDANLRVRREDGTPIEGLFAAGEVIGAAATTGNAFCGGMLVTPAISFGRLIGTRLGAAARS